MLSDGRLPRYDLSKNLHLKLQCDGNGNADTDNRGDYNRGDYNVLCTGELKIKWIHMCVKFSDRQVNACVQRSTNSTNVAHYFSDSIAISHQWLPLVPISMHVSSH